MNSSRISILLRAATSSEFARYLATGLATFAVYCVVNVVCLKLAGLYPSFAAGFAVAGSAILNYWAHTRFTFKSDTHFFYSAPRYAVLIAFNSILAATVVYILANFAGASILAANAACLALITIVNFFLLKRFVMPPAANRRR